MTDYVCGSIAWSALWFASGVITGDLVRTYLLPRRRK